MEFLFFNQACAFKNRISTFKEVESDVLKSSPSTTQSTLQSGSTKKQTQFLLEVHPSQDKAVPRPNPLTQRFSNWSG